ncbi:hypothetical protein OID55_42160 (plasmid) [Streptomyces sp. NBC_00715]|uniref:hypothetical protein n=1 Tax=Streptomyces sp. NBC_00715 TaxID=2975811 RepID=UPI003869D396
MTGIVAQTAAGSCTWAFATALPMERAISDGRAPASICVDACLTLRNAYGQLGVRAELLLVTVAIRRKGGAGTLYGSLTPTWTGTSWNGHYALVLPDSERFVDPSIEQFDEARKIGMDPMVGSMVEPGAQVVMQRGDLTLTYIDAGPEALASIVEHPEAIAHADRRRTGVSTASLTLAALRAEGVCDRALQAPHPRLHARVQAVGEAPYASDEAQDVRFRLPDQCGQERWLRLDEIPLAPDTPAAWPRGTCQSENPVSRRAPQRSALLSGAWRASRRCRSRGYRSPMPPECSSRPGWATCAGGRRRWFRTWLRCSRRGAGSYQ